MELSIVLQVALFLASLAVIVLVACIVPLAFKTRENSEKLVRHIEEMKLNAQTMSADLRELIHHLNELSQRANQQMDDVTEIVHTVRQWTQRTDRVVNEVGTVIEAPIFAAVRNINVLRAGMVGFLQRLFYHKQHKPNHEENDHVRQS